ncbi:MAG TPA: 50S ribosomal protein L35 [Caldilineae bacterium]|nr:50S ribosomal protein L35 [Caldilineae bacterium]
MPKIKTHKATAKRFRLSGNRKLLRMKQGKGHLRRKKPRRVRAMYDDTLTVEHASVRRRVARLAPYLKKNR